MREWEEQFTLVCRKLLEEPENMKIVHMCAMTRTAARARFLLNKKLHFSLLICFLMNPIPHLQNKIMWFLYSFATFLLKNEEGHLLQSLYEWVLRTFYLTFFYLYSKERMSYGRWSYMIKCLMCVWSGGVFLRVLYLYLWRPAELQESPSMFLCL